VSGYLVDTDVLSEPQKPRPHGGVLRWLREHEADLYTSAVVIGELAWGIARLPSGKKRRDLASWLRDGVIASMEGRILRFDTRVALEWGALQAQLEAKGRPMPWRDSVIAATARRHALVLATRNAKDYRHATVEVKDPFAI
jgi:predicted nucleic acid-binding protein